MTDAKAPAPPSAGADGGSVEVARKSIVTGLGGRRGFQTTVSMIVVAALWEGFARLTPPFVAPTWGAIIEALLNLRLEFVLTTTLRVVVALAASFIIGLALAMVLYALQRVEGYVLPVVNLVMAVPVVCWVIFTILWFSMIEYRIAFVLVIVCAPIFLIDILDAMKSVPKQQREMARAFRPTRAQYYSKLILPATVPAILTSWKINLSLAIRVVTIAELVGAVSGIGYGLVIAKELFSIADVFAWTIILVVMLLFAQALLERVERRLLHWRD
jgi:NitT/TauT family transport system permease protein